MGNTNKKQNRESKEYKPRTDGEVHLKDSAANSPSFSDGEDFTIRVGNRWYAVHNPIGKGGFSQVFLGVDVITKKRVALKILGGHEKNKGDAKSQMNQAHKEIKAMKLFDHLNVVRLMGYDLRCDVHGKSSIVIIQQLCSKGELFDYLMHTKHFQPRAAIPLFIQLLRGIKHMHDNGVAHRDLKPENLLFDRDYTLKIVDFGFAFPFFKRGESRDMRTELGTKGYMAPEVLAKHKSYTQKCDIFSAGVIFFIMLAGFPPFQHAKDSDWWFNKLRKKNYPLFWKAHERTATFDKNAKRLLVKMMAPKEADRLSVSEVLEHPYLTRKDVLDKHELKSEMIRRREIVQQHQPKDSHREMFAELFGELKNMPGYGLLLKSLLGNPLVAALKEIGNIDYEESRHTGPKQHLWTVLKDVSPEQDFQAEIEKTVSAFPSEDRAIDVAQILRDRDFKWNEDSRHWENDGIKNLLDDGVFSPKMMDRIIARIKMTALGSVDDWSIVHRAVEIENQIPSLPLFTPDQTRFFTYRTRMGFGVLGYLLVKFAQENGSLTVDPGHAEIHLNIKAEHDVLLPAVKVEKDDIAEDDDLPDSDVQWQKGALNVEINIAFQLMHAKELNTNVLIIKDESDPFMMNHARDLIKKLTTENELYLARLLDGRMGVQIADDTEEEFFREMVKKTNKWTIVNTSKGEAVRISEPRDDGTFQVQYADGTNDWITESDLKGLQFEEEVEAAGADGDEVAWNYAG